MAESETKDKVQPELTNDKYNLIQDGGKGDAERESKLAQMQLTEKPHSKSGPAVEGLLIIIISFVVFAAGVTVALIVTIYCAPPMVPPHGAVNSEDAVCSAIGLDALKEDGSVVDAAISTFVCLTVTQPHVASLGGGGFLLLFKSKKNQSWALDFTEVSPQSLQTGDTVAIPRTLQGLKQAYDEHGSRNWKDLFKGAIDLARNGFKISKTLAQALANYSVCPTEVFCKGDEPLKEGETTQNPKYADLLEMLSKGDEDQFFQEISTAAGSSFLADDISAIEGVVLPAIKRTFRDNSVFAVPNPAAGDTLSVMLGLLDKYKNWSKKSSDDALYYHRIIEVLKLQGNISKSLSTSDVGSLLSDLGSLLRDNGTVNPITPPPVSFMGTKLTAVSPGEELVTFTASLGGVFGSKILTDSNFFLNDFLAYETESRPLQHSSPVVIRGPKACGLRMALASDSIAELVQVLSYRLIRGFDTDKSVSSPRLRVAEDWSVAYEDNLEDVIVNGLTHRGQTMTPTKGTSADEGVSIVGKNNETIFGSADKRGSFVSKIF